MVIEKSEIESQGNSLEEKILYEQDPMLDLQ